MSLPWQPSDGNRNDHGQPSAERSTANLNVSPSATSPSQNIQGQNTEIYGDALRRKRSSVSVKISSFRQAGGVNSIDNFARSWQRAVGFHEITPVRRSSFTLHDDDDADDVEEEPSNISRSLLRQQIEAAGGFRRVESAIGDDDHDYRRREQRASEETNPHVYSSLANLTSPLSRSMGTSYGTLSSRINETSRRHAAQLFQAQQLSGAQGPDKEAEPLLVREVANHDGTVSHVVIGQSTLPQTVFNSVNTLIGVGLLSLPLGLKYSGWLIGLTFIIFAASTTSYTAKLLAVCLDIDPSLLTYADLAYVSFGSRARIVTGCLFSFELIVASVALVVLFADSLDALIPGFGLVEWKLLCGLALIPFNFAPLRILSFSSILGILCCTLLVGIVVTDGLIKPHTPGSLLEPATTYLFPENWSTIPLSLGLLMSPWGGHSVFPSIYRDMRHPKRYGQSLWYTYIFTFGIDSTMAVVGLIMFGDLVQEEITSNILRTPGYPPFFSILIVVLIAIIPLTKIPLSCRPIINTVEVVFGLDPRLFSSDSNLQGMSPLSRGLFKIAIRILVVVVIVLIAIFFPNFDSIMALMGSTLCFTICIILPLAFYLKIFGSEISLRERILDWALIVSCTAMAILGTIWACLPKDKIGAR